jgi:threonine aldolase
MEQQQAEQIWNNCTRFLTQHYPRKPKQVLSELATSIEPEEALDMYGQGGAINRFEAEIADLLGKEAAVFMPGGTMCQPIALRIWSDRRNCKNVAFHPTCHLEIHEQKGYQMLHGLHSVLVGSPYQMITLKDLEAVSEPLGALLLELPQREIGGQLPSWEDLNEQVAWARNRGIPLHLDGARLWECKPFYGRSYAEIAGLFDTVYVSFYKVLDGIAGAILAGPADVIAEARIWQRRQGGNLVHLYPYVLAAQQGMAKHLERMDEYCAKAKEVAVTLARFPQIELKPNPPQTNMMHVMLRGDRQKLLDASLAIAEKHKVRLLKYLTPTSLPGFYAFELTVGEATLDLKNEEIEALFHELFELAGA